MTIDENTLMSSENRTSNATRMAGQELTVRSNPTRDLDTHAVTLGMMLFGEQTRVLSITRIEETHIQRGGNPNAVSTKRTLSKEWVDEAFVR